MNENEEQKIISILKAIKIEFPSKRQQSMDLLRNDSVDDTAVVRFESYLFWNEVPDEIIRESGDSLSFFSGDAYRFFSPAYFSYVLRQLCKSDFSLDIVGPLLFTIHMHKMRYSSNEQTVILDFLNLLYSRSAENYGKTLTRCIKVFSQI